MALHDLGFLSDPRKVDAELLMEHVRAVGGWYMEDREVTIDSARVMEAIAAVSDPRSSFYRLMRRENLPANELMGRRMESGRPGRARPAAGHAQLVPDRQGVVVRRSRRRPSWASSERAGPRSTGFHRHIDDHEQQDQDLERVDREHAPDPRRRVDAPRLPARVAHADGQAEDAGR